MKKKNIIDKNFLEKIPMRSEGIGWKTDDNGLITLEIENTGWANKLAQAFFKRPKLSYIHLDKMGSFIWPLLDGKMTITQLGKQVEDHFGEEAHPLYERLSKYLQIMHSYHFIKWVE